MSEDNEIRVKVEKDESEELKKLREENEELKERQILIAQLEFQRKKEKLGCKDEEITTVEQLQAWEKGKGIKSASQLKAEQEANPKGQAGTAPLNSEQLGLEMDLYKKMYPKTKEGYKDMLHDLRLVRDTSNDDEERAKAKAVLDEFLKKSVTGKFDVSKEPKLKRKRKKRVSNE